VLPAYTSFSVPSAVANAGLQAALYDLNIETLSPDIASLQEAINERTLCVVVCHLYGYPCDIDAVLAVAKEAGVPVIDDAAQAMGATFRGRKMGTMGDAGLFSLSRGKNISTVDGGIVVTNSHELAREFENIALKRVGLVQGCLLVVKALILSLMLHPLLYGIPGRLPFLNIGTSVFNPNFPLQRFTAFQAGIGRRILRRLEKINADRREKAHLIMERLACKLKFPTIIPGADPVYLRLPVIDGSTPLGTHPELGIVSSYPAPLDEIEGFKPYLARNIDFPGAKHLGKKIITLPTHEFVRKEDIEKITGIGKI